MDTLARFDETISLKPLEPPLPNGYYLLYLPDGSRQRFKIHTRQFGERQRVLSHAIGPEGTRDYEVVGLVHPEGIEVHKRHRNTKLSEYARLLQLLYDGTEAEGYRLLIDPRCFACNRLLKDEQSRARGYGPTCWARSPYSPRD